MRLVDADDMMKHIYVSENGDHKLVNVLRDWIMAQPTVEAVPITWLEASIAKCREHKKEYQADMLQVAIDIWRDMQR